MIRSELVRLPRVAKHLLMVVADMLVLPFALWSSIALRLGELNVQDGPPLWSYGLTVLISLPLFLHKGLYRAVVRYLETRAFLTVISASLAAAGLFALVVLLLRVPGIPGTALVIYAVLSSGYVTLTRLLARQWLRAGQRATGERVRVAIYGAGAAGRQLVQALRHEASFQPVAFIDDNPALQGRTVMGLRIGPRSTLPDLIEDQDLRIVIVAIPSLTPGKRAQLLRGLEPLKIEVRLLPGVTDLIRSGEGGPDIRVVSPEDLLGRDAVDLDEPALHSFLRSRVVMVTGGGGSIGSELCRQIAVYKPALLVVLDLNEYSLYALREEFVVRWPEMQLVTAIGDVKNGPRVSQVIGQYRPAVVFHAAAYKHVPLMEEVNAWEALRNNTFGTYVVGRACIDHGVEKFVLVSTDKAVNPTNVMGATKRLAEMVCQALHSEGSTRFEMVRFGNVLGSSGSVIPKFRDQIARGGPITVTHPDIVRYFMSIPEAAQLVLQAACMGQGGEVFVLDMGEPVRILDLALKMISLSGHTEHEIGVEFTGLRPGEKLYEELLADSEATRATHHPKIRVARVASAPPDWCRWLAAWVSSHPCVSDVDVRRQMSELLPEYRPWSDESDSSPVPLPRESRGGATLDVEGAGRRRSELH